MDQRDAQRFESLEITERSIEKMKELVSEFEALLHYEALIRARLTRSTTIIPDNFDKAFELLVTKQKPNKLRVTLAALVAAAAGYAVSASSNFSTTGNWEWASLFAALAIIAIGFQLTILYPE